MSEQVEKLPEPVAGEKVALPGTLTVVISVTATCRPEDGEEVARAVLAATRVLVPGVKIG